MAKHGSIHILSLKQKKNQIIGWCRSKIVLNVLCYPISRSVYAGTHCPNIFVTSEFSCQSSFLRHAFAAFRTNGSDTSENFLVIKKMHTFLFSKLTAYSYTYLFSCKAKRFTIK